MTTGLLNPRQEREQQAATAQRAREKAFQRDEDLRLLMQDNRFRRFIGELLPAFRYGETIFSTNAAQMAAWASLADYCNRHLVQRIESICPGQVAAVVVEAKEKA